MNKQAILILVFSVVALSLAQVALTRHILLFTQTSQTGPQTRVNAHGVCVSLGNPVRPFLSGRSGSHIPCHVWANRNCSSTATMVSATGTDFWLPWFTEGPLSVLC
jgi:hypothetical protein